MDDGADVSAGGMDEYSDDGWRTKVERERGRLQGVKVDQTLVLGQTLTRGSKF